MFGQEQIQMVVQILSQYPMLRKNYGKEWQPLTQPLVIKANKSDFRCAIILSVIDAQKSFLDDPHLNDQTTGSTVILGFK